LGSALNETFRNHRESSLHRGPDDFVFCKKDGSALDPDVLRKDALYPILDRLGIPRRKGASGFHTFRHSAASIVNDRTGNLKLAQKFLGHSRSEERRVGKEWRSRWVPEQEKKNKNNSIART